MRYARATRILRTAAATALTVGIVAAPFFLRFDRPLWLAGLIVPIALLFWTWFRSDRHVALPFDHTDRRHGLRWWSTISLVESLLPALLAAAILLLAVPTIEGNPIRQRRLSNIEFCVDCSGSMTAQFGDGSRYDASMQ
ncbi:MAG: hypothetical protein KDA85_07505, partial [Planctomycetaceae bacterium]|nr:hypothetical protein [Planctomycetaceae bacterium]